MARTDTAQFAQAVTPSDTANFASTLGLYVGVAGNIKVDMAGVGPGVDPVVFLGATAGSILPVRVTRVYLTGTTATNILALY